MRVWRLCRKAHTAFDGEGARRAGGRWNRRGTAVVYASESVALAALELLVHAAPTLLPEDLVAIPAEIPEGTSIETITPGDLPRGWRSYPPPETLAEMGTAWARSGRSAVLVVPSAVVPSEHNFLIHPGHPEFRRLRVGKPEPFALDPRLAAGRRSG